MKSAKLDRNKTVYRVTPFRTETVPNPEDLYLGNSFSEAIKIYSRCTTPAYMFTYEIGQLPDTVK